MIVKMHIHAEFFLHGFFEDKHLVKSKGLHGAIIAEVGNFCSKMQTVNSKMVRNFLAMLI